MRQVLKSIMLIAAAAMAFTSCQKEETAAPETVSATLTMHAGVEQTKTYLDENNAVLWGKGEVVKLYVGSGESAKFFDSASTDKYDGEASASFTFDIKEVDQADSYALGGIYPASAAMDDNKNAKQYKVILPATQNQVDGNYDPSAYIMVLKPEVVTELPTEYTASFRRAAALNKITLTGVKENISSVEITVPEKKYLAGRRYMDLTTGESGEVYYDQSNKVTVNSLFTGNSIDVWFTSWGVELAEGDELSIKMTSATKTYTRTIAARAEGIKFVEGDLNTLTVNMSSATVETLDNFSGEYLIVNTDLTRAAQAWAGGNNLPEFVLNARDGVVYESEGIENCKMTIEAQADGKYTIKDAKNQYLYAPSSEKNYLNGLKESSESTCWTIVKDGDKYILTSLGNNSRNILRYNGTNNPPIFSCYGSGQSDVTLYKYSDIKPDTTPSISLTKNSDQVTFDATSYEFTYTTKNIAGDVAATIKEGATMTNVSASASNGTVTVKFDANAEADQKTATIVLSYEGAVSQEFVLTQAGKPAAGTVVDVLTRATTGISSGAGYSAWSGKTVTSSAVYAGQSAGGNDAIQLRTTNNNSGVVTTTSGGKVKKIKVTWQSSTSSDRTLDIYGKNTAYTAATDLYNSSNQGTKLGSIKYGTSTELVISGDYEYIGLRSASGAMYLTEIEITWETSGAGGETPEPDPTPDPEPDPEPDPTPDPEQPGEGGGEKILKLTNADIVSNTVGGTVVDGSYKNYTITAEDGSAFNACCIWHYHSKATNSNYFLQIKKDEKYYIQLPQLSGNIKKIVMTVSSSSKAMDGGSNTATLGFGKTTTHSSAEATGKGASSVEINVSGELSTGYITASGAVRIWDIEITYTN